MAADRKEGRSDPVTLAAAMASPIAQRIPQSNERVKICLRRKANQATGRMNTEPQKILVYNKAMRSLTWPRTQQKGPQ